MGNTMDGKEAILSFDDGFGKRKSKPYTLYILRFAAAIETFENMGNIFRGDAVSVVCDADPYGGRGGIPDDADDTLCIGVIQSIFDEIG